MTTEERLEKLEHELKETKAGLTAVKCRNRWMLGGGTLLILGCLTIAATPGGNRTIRANGFVVEDENGKCRAMISATQSSAALMLFDGNGKVRAQMNVTTNGPGLFMTDERDKLRAQINVGKDGPGLCMTDENEKARIGMDVSFGVAGLCMTDENGKARVEASVSNVDKGRGVDGLDGLRTFMHDMTDGPEIVMRDAKGKTIWKAP